MDSSATYGVQVADAFAYCTLKHKMNDVRFVRFWDIIHNMLWKDDSGRMLGYDYNEYPKCQECVARNPPLTHPIGDISSPFGSTVLQVIL